jgi:hypothetical protein
VWASLWHKPLYITDALKAGRLVTPFPIVATTQEAWYIL